MMSWELKKNLASRAKRNSRLDEFSSPSLFFFSVCVCSPSKYISLFLTLFYVISLFLFSFSPQKKKITSKNRLRRMDKIGPRFFYFPTPGVGTRRRLSTDCANKRKKDLVPIATGKEEKPLQLQSKFLRADSLILDWLGENV